MSWVSFMFDSVHIIHWTVHYRCFEKTVWRCSNGVVCCLMQRGFTPLHMAAKFGKLKVARLLLDKGTDVDAEAKYKLTPLHVATHYGNTDVASLLLARNAKPQRAAKVLQQLSACVFVYGNWWKAHGNEWLRFAFLLSKWMSSEIKY